MKQYKTNNKMKLYLHYFTENVSPTVTAVDCVPILVSVWILWVVLQPVVQLKSTSEVINRWSIQLPPRGLSADPRPPTPGTPGTVRPHRYSAQLSSPVG